MVLKSTSQQQKRFLSTTTATTASSTTNTTSTSTQDQIYPDFYVPNTTKAQLEKVSAELSEQKAKTNALEQRYEALYRSLKHDERVKSFEEYQQSMTPDERKSMWQHRALVGTLSTLAVVTVGVTFLGF